MHILMQHIRGTKQGTARTASIEYVNQAKKSEMKKLEIGSIKPHITLNANIISSTFGTETRWLQLIQQMNEAVQHRKMRATYQERSSAFEL